jgi:GAF domain-containing protein
MPESRDNALAAASAQLLSLLTNAPHLDIFLDRVVHLAAGVVDPPASVGLTLRRDDRPFTVVSSDLLAAQVDEIQYGRDQGPCLDSLRQGIVVRVDDLTRDERWDGYPTHAITHGVMSSLSLPLTVDGQTVAALNLYSGKPNAFDGPVRRHAEAFANQCAAALALALRQIDQAQLQQQLMEAVNSRCIIDQALGILMGQQRCTATAAFDLLRQASQHRNRKLRDVAGEIITNMTGEPPHPPADFKIQPRNHGRTDGP